ncbi:MAG: hypothetical protein JWO48_2477 [Bryobacterales bacterium]|nr:hypothetical protein [Bryobacterales bacterium]
MGPTQPAAPHGLASLRRLAGQRAPDERCDFCSLALGEEHDHLVEPGRSPVICACYACAVLFTNTGETRYRRVPRLIRRLEGFQLTDEQWNGLGIPISMVFFFSSSITNKVSALYPSPAGPTESLLDLDAWEEIVQNNSVLRTISPDVEALLVSRVGSARDYYLAPIDQCYKLTGLIRRHWRGFSGGDDAWNEIRRFFSELYQRSIPTSVGHHA